jgi:hypothetical protein
LPALNTVLAENNFPQGLAILQICSSRVIFLSCHLFLFFTFTGSLEIILSQIMKTIFKKRLLALVCILTFFTIISWSENNNSDVIGSGEQPQISLDKQGVIRIVFGQKDEIFCVTSSDKGNTFSDPVLVAKVSQMHLGMGRGPQIASSNHFSIITAMDQEGNIHWFQLENSSKEWQKMSTVNDVNGSAPEGLMSIAADQNDHFYAVWLDTRTGKKNQIYFSSLSKNKNHWAPNILAYQSPDGHVCECCKPSIAVQQSQVAIMFRNWVNGSRDLYLLRSSNNGKSFNPVQKLGMDTWKLNGCPMDGGSVAFNASNFVQTVWQRQGSIFYCEPGKPEVKVGEGRIPGISEVSGNAVVTMQTKDTVKMVSLTNNKETIVGNGSFLKSITLPDSKLLCVWQQDNTIKFKRF